MGRIKFPYMFSCQSILLFVLFGISKYWSFILTFYCYLDKRTRLTRTCKKTFIQNIFVNEKNYSSWLSGKAEKVNDPFWNIYGEKIFEILSLSRFIFFGIVYIYIMSKEWLVEDAFFWKFDAFSQTFFYSHFDMSDG